MKLGRVKLFLGAVGIQLFVGSMAVAKNYDFSELDEGVEVATGLMSWMGYTAIGIMAVVLLIGTIIGAAWAYFNEKKGLLPYFVGAAIIIGLLLSAPFIGMKIMNIWKSNTQQNMFNGE